MSNLIKKFNVTINGDSATYEVGADAKNVQFSDEATSPFANEFVENNDNQNKDVPKEIVSKAENRVYGNAYIKNNDWDDIEGTPEDFGPIDDVEPDRRTEGAGALTITYGFNSLAKGHHSTAIGFDCEAAGWASHAEGWKATTAQGANYSHAEGAKTEANHNAAHAEGDAAKAYGYGSHAEGRGTYVYGAGSHVEGMASNIGYADKVAWQNSNTLHGFDMTNDASNNDVDVELTYPKQVINGQLSHAEGMGHIVLGSCCHAEGVGNTISNVYASTAMGEANKIHSNTSLVIGFTNTLDAGSDNSLILGNNNTNPGYPNSLFLGHYCGVGSEESQPPALVIGSGDENTPSNLMTIRHPQTGVASATNRGELDGEHLNAYFGNNKWIWAKYEAYSDGQTDFITFASANYANFFVSKKLILIIWLNEFTKELKVTLSPMPDGWLNGNPNDSVLILTGLGPQGAGGIKNYFSSESEVGAQTKIENIISRLSYSGDTATYIHEDGHNYLSHGKLDIKKIFSSDPKDAIRLKYMSGPSFPADAHPAFRYSFIY